MEDALISPEGFMILSGAGLIEASETSTLKQHVTEKIDSSATNSEGELLVQVTGDGPTAVVTIKLTNKPYLPASTSENYAYVMFMKDGQIITEPYIPVHENVEKGDDGYYTITVQTTTRGLQDGTYEYGVQDVPTYGYDCVLVDYYTERTSGMKQIEITADKFGGSYYLEAQTLFRDEHGIDLPAEFIIPNCNVQSNFTFTMASTGDPSTFTFTMDAFPDYTRFDHSKKVICALQIIDTAEELDLVRTYTAHEEAHEELVEGLNKYISG
jgi:hypothetical protein